MASTSKKATSFYRSTDPIENFRLQVRVRETSRIPLADGEGRQGDALYKDVEIAWQEKLYGPADIADFINSGDRKPKNPSEQESRRQLHAMEDSGKKVPDLLEDVMIYTYTDRDSRAPKNVSCSSPNQICIIIPFVNLIIIIQEPCTDFDLCFHYLLQMANNALINSLPRSC